MGVENDELNESTVKTSDGRASNQSVDVVASSLSVMVHQLACTQEVGDPLLKNTYLMIADLLTMYGITGEHT